MSTAGWRESYPWVRRMREVADRPQSFEVALRELRRIVESLDQEELTLDQALALFEQGVSHLRGASRLLDAAHGRVEELIEGAAEDLSLIGFEVEAEGAEGNGGAASAEGEVAEEDT
jgi:exodeoxyribonuclease VII small subunit